MKALLNLLGDLAAQLRHSGGRLPRLRCVLRYWLLYADARRRNLSRDRSRLEALAVMSRAGAMRETVRMNLGRGLRGEFDVFSACYMAREIIDQGSYRRRGFVPQEGWTVLDVGAHQGLFTLDSACRVGPRGKVLAFEPLPFNHALLERNAADNRLSWVRVVPAAVSDVSGTRVLFVSPYVSGGNSLVIKDSEECIEVKTVTLDRALEDAGIKNVHLLKIDVEGAWRLVFGGASCLLARRPRLLMEVEGDEIEMEQAQAYLRGLGYAVERESSVLFAAAGAL